MIGMSGIRYLQSSFQPNWIAGCQIWLKSTVGLTYNSTTISAWADLSGNGNNFSQGTAANQATYNTAPINSRPSLRFNGTSDTYACANNVALTATSAMIVIIVPRTLTSGVVTAILIPKDISSYTILNTTSWGEELTGNVLDGALSVGTQYCLIINNHAINNVDLITNGSSTNVVTGTALRSRTGTALGSDPTNVQFNNCDIGEVIAFNATLTAGQVTTLRTYLSAAWGFTA